MKLRALLTIVIVLCLALPALAQKQVTITYLSADHIYLNGGREEGLQIGQQVTVVRDGQAVATLTVVYLSDHSSSCTVAEASVTLKAGDIIDLPEAAPAETTSVIPLATDTIVAPQRPAEAVPAPVVTSRVAPAPDVWGSFAIGMLGWRDTDADDRNYTQSNVRLNLRTRHLMNDRLTLTVRSRGRYDERNRTYRPTADARVWLNRIYELSALYRSNDDRWHVTLGRAPILSVAALGVIDGLVVERKAGAAFTFGAFGGLQPQWQYSEGRASLSRFGLMGEFRQEYGNVSWKTAGAILREYHRSVIGRDALMLQSNANNRDKWQASLLAEMDYNSGWRREKAGTTLALTSFYGYARYRVAKGIALNTNYGSRKTVWLWDYHDLADTLLDDGTRRWVRFGADLNPGSRWALGGSVGAYFQDIKTRRQLTTSVYGRINRLWDPRSSVWAQYSTSEGRNENAHTASIRVTQGIWRLDQFSVAYGRNSYQVSGADTRSSWWAEGELQKSLVDRLMLRLRYRHAAGDDLRGKEFETEVGYRF